MVALDDALEYYHKGWSIVPMRMDEAKRPAVNRWKCYQSNRPSEQIVRKWFRYGRPGIGVIFGKTASGGC